MHGIEDLLFLHEGHCGNNVLQNDLQRFLGFGSRCQTGRELPFSHLTEERLIDFFPPLEAFRDAVIKRLQLFRVIF